MRVISSLSLLALLGLGGCELGVATEQDGGAPAPGATPAAEDRQMRTVLSLVDNLHLCDIDHRGVLVDMGGHDDVGRYAYDLGSPALGTPRTITSSEHDGATWAKLYERDLRLSFRLNSVAPIFVSLRGIGHNARSADVYLDGAGLGRIVLKEKEIRVDSTGTTQHPLDPGVHVLQLRFRGRKRGDAEPYAEIDWVRVGTPDELTRTYGPPTRADIVDTTTKLSGVPHRSIAVHAPAAVRCAMRVPRGARLRVAVGMQGHGSASAAVVVHRDGAAPEELERVEVEGGDDATWSNVEVPLSSYASQLVALELGALRTTGTGRLLLGDPVIVVDDVAPVPVPAARSVVLVLLSGVDITDLPPWRGVDAPHLPALSELARTATVFMRHRVPSTLVSASVASLMTGLSPLSHTLANDGAKLPDKLMTLARTARDASLRAGMFTGVPLTFEAFGFHDAWATFQSYPPNEGAPASAPYDDAGAWLTAPAVQGAESEKVLAVIHARGGHPPWEVTPPEATQLPPTDYAGFLDPRRAAQRMAEVRSEKSRLSAQDEERMRALFFTGLHRQDQALGALVRRLQDAGRWDSTLFIVTADVASGRRSLFADGGDLDEHRLHAPLYVHFPDSLHAETRVDEPSEMVDLTRTAMLALGLKPTPDMGGRDLSWLASAPDPDPLHTQIAFTDVAVSARWGDLVLHGALDKRLDLCDLVLDPTCAVDRSEVAPMAAHALYRLIAEHVRNSPRPPERQPLTMDSATSAMLDVWGALGNP